MVQERLFRPRNEPLQNNHQIITKAKKSGSPLGLDEVEIVSKGYYWPVVPIAQKGDNIAQIGRYSAKDHIKDSDVNKFD